MTKVLERQPCTSKDSEIMHLIKLHALYCAGASASFMFHQRAIPHVRLPTRAFFSSSYFSPLSYPSRSYAALFMLPHSRPQGSSRNFSRRRTRFPRPPPPPMPAVGEPGRNQFREAIRLGCKVAVIKKENQRSGVETFGVVSRLLTKSHYHPRGIKCMLDDGTVGRVTRILEFFDEDTCN